MQSIVNQTRSGILFGQQNSRYSYHLSRYISLNWSERKVSINDQTIESITSNQRRSFSLQAVPGALTKSIANSSAVDYTQKLLINIHDLTGLPWFAEIILASFLLRTTLLPIVMYERHLSYVFDTKLKNELKIKLDQLNETAKRKLQLRELTSVTSAKKYVNRQRRLIKQELYIKYNVHPFKRVICVLTPFPLWVIMSFSIGGLCSSFRHDRYVEKQSIIENIIFTKLEAQVEGALWFKDLTMPDPYLVLSVFFMMIMYISSEFAKHLRKHNWIENTRIRTFIFALARVASVLMFMISIIQPSGLTLYWTSNSLTAFMQNVMLLNPKVKKVLKIRDTPHSFKASSLTDFKDHFRDKFVNLKNKFVK